MENNDTDEEAGELVPLDAQGIKPQLERTPTVLLLDTSGSMDAESQTPDGARKKKIKQLNEGLRIFNDEIEQKKHSSERVDISVITFGNGISVEHDFSSFGEWNPKTLEAGGATPMGGGIKKAIEVIETQKSFYRENAIQYNRPLIWILTDGEPTDMKPGGSLWRDVQDKLREGTAKGKFTIFAMAIGSTAIEKLNKLVKEPSGRPALPLKEGMFVEYFQFLSKSLEQVSTHDHDDSSLNLDKDDLEKFTQID